jgi:hypothetical protein
LQFLGLYSKSPELAFNQWVDGSSPSRLINKNNKFNYLRAATKDCSICFTTILLGSIWEHTRKNEPRPIDVLFNQQKLALDLITWSLKDFIHISTYWFKTSGLPKSISLFQPFHQEDRLSLAKIPISSKH